MAIGATRVKTELTEEKAKHLRSELDQIAQAYPATYGVVVLDPSSGERVAMDAAEMLDIMTDTSFEDRLPQPLPEGTRVSHKIGYYGTTFADTGVVFSEGARRPRRLSHGRDSLRHE